LEFHSNLKAVVTHADGTTTEYNLGSGLVTTVGVAFLANDFAGVSGDITTINYHDSGTGVVAAAIGDVGLGTGTGNARVAGTQTSPAGGQYRTVAVLSYTAAHAITEWALLSALTAGTLWDRKVFAAINVVSGDGIQFTYTLTCNSGG